MSNSAYQLQFAAELVAMLVAVAGLVLVVLRADLTGEARWARAVLAVGFVAVGVAAFVHGSLLSSNASQHSQHELSALRLAGDAAIALGAARWRASLGVRAALWFGVAVSAAAGIAGLTGGSSTLIDVLLIAGSAGVAVALVAGSRRSIVARVAAGAAATLLLMVLVLSVALSSVIANSSQRDQLNSLASRARVEGGAALTDSTTSVKDARFVAADLQGYFRQDPTALIALRPDVPTGPVAANEAAVASRLGELAGLYPSVGLAYVIGSGKALTAPSPGATGDLLALVAHQPLVTGLSCGDTSGQSSVMVAGTSLMVAAVYPLCLSAAAPASAPGGTRLGVVVVISPLDDAYLAGRAAIDPSTSLALVAPAGVLATAGPQPPALLLQEIGRAALSAERSSTSSQDERELAVQPLDDADGRPVAALVVSTTNESVLHAQARLERTLFLIALGGTVIALLFLAAIGERITAGLRRLTEVAERVRRGGTGERAGIEANDEVGALGAAFDSMVASIERQTDDLQAAADDEARLRNRLQAVVAGMGDALVATDGDGHVIEFNAAAAELTGVAAPAAFGAVVGDVVELVGDDGTRFGARLQAPASSWTALAQLRRSDTTEVPVAVSAGVLRGPAGEAAGGVLVIRDLRREQELERMKSEFLSRVGHELRTPLTAIMGYSEILMSRKVTAAQSRSWHGEILSSAKRLARIVELLEFFASTGAGRILLNPEPLDVEMLMSEVAAEWQGRIGDRHSLVNEVAASTPTVIVDRRWLALALNELMDNAVKFSPGGGRISLGAHPALEGGGVDITVGDRGMGMTEQERLVAFGEFVQGDASDTRHFGGLGLGLALVLRVVEGHGGSVLCDSSPGGGSRLTIRLPAAHV